MIFTENFDHLFEISIGGSNYGGWTQASVTRSVGEMTGSFNVTLHDPRMLLMGSSSYAAMSAAAEPGTPVQVYVDGEVYLTGYIDSRSASKSATSHSVTISGRGKARDIIDSSHVPKKKTNQYNKKKPTDIFKEVATPHGIQVVPRDIDEKELPYFRFFPGDDAFSVIMDAARGEGITLTEDRNGNLVARQKDKGPAAGPIVQGQNILTYSVQKSDAQRAGKYHGRGQNVPGQKVRGKKANHPNKTVTDGGARPNRQRVLLVPSDVDKRKVEKATLLEAGRRAAMSLKVSVTLYGYRGASGQLWEPDTLAFVSIPDEGVAEELLIESVQFTKSNSGSITTLSLTRKEAYEAKKTSGKGQGPKGAVGGGSKAPPMIIGTSDQAPEE